MQNNAFDAQGHSAKDQNVRDTSIEMYYKLIFSGQANNEEKRCYYAWSVKGEASDRMIAKMTGIEKGNIPRCRQALMRKGLLEPLEKRQCEVTRNTVHYYRIKQQESK